MQRIMNSVWARRRLLMVYATLLAFGWVFGATLRDIAVPEVRPIDRPMLNGMVATAIVAYVVLAAIPFVPGAEIGLALLLVFGAKAAPVVYFGMVGALLLAYGCARIFPPAALAAAFGWLGMHKAAGLARRLDGKAPQEREQIVAQWLAGGPAGWFPRNRYLALGIAINTPGNTLLGGGGGLAFAAGLSGLYPAKAFLAIVMIAVAPVPLVFLLAG